MTTKEIKALLQRYYEGTSTEDEVSRLGILLNRDDISKEWEEERTYFNVLNELQHEEVSVPSDLKQQVTERLQYKQTSHSGQRFRLLYFLSGAAAVLLIMLSALWWLKSGKNGRDTFSDPKLAYAETQQAINLVAYYFGEGTRPLQKIEKFKEAVKPLQTLQEIESAEKKLGYFAKINEGYQTAKKVLKGK
ncbi:MAG: hypothetical protein J7L89_02375 [Bacteroidales bacterium]|nr:hypothetical protein [Bacteroidales bacterium]